MIKCNVCGKENAADVEVCARCGVTLVKNRLSLSTRLEIRLQGDEQPTFQLDPPETEGYVFGRSDDTSEYLPDIDLSPYGAREQGVSRRHAALVSYRGMVHVVDLQSVNGTYLNGVRLLADTPYPLAPGDDLRLANLALVVAASDT